MNAIVSTANSTDDLRFRRVLPIVFNDSYESVSAANPSVFRELPFIDHASPIEALILRKPVFIILDAIEEFSSEIESSTIELIKPPQRTVLLTARNSAQTQNAFNLATRYFTKSFNQFSQQEQFNRTILRLLELEPIEDGYSHPAERIIEDALKRYKQAALTWIQSIYLKNIKRPAIAAGILRCIGSLKRTLAEPWGNVMAINGLSHPDMEVREAAVRALEMWGGRESLEILKIYIDIEQIPWLKSYIKQVIDDLSR